MHNKVNSEIPKEIYDEVYNKIKKYEISNRRNKNTINKVILPLFIMVIFGMFMFLDSSVAFFYDKPTGEQSIIILKNDEMYFKCGDINKEFIPCFSYYPILSAIALEEKCIEAETKIETANIEGAMCIDSHEKLNLKEAMDCECNVYFCKLERKVGEEKLSEYFKKYNFKKLNPYYENRFGQNILVSLRDMAHNYTNIVETLEDIYGNRDGIIFENQTSVLYRELNSDDSYINIIVAKDNKDVVVGIQLSDLKKSKIDTENLRKLVSKALK